MRRGTRGGSLACARPGNGEAGWGPFLTRRCHSGSCESDAVGARGGRAAGLASATSGLRRLAGGLGDVDGGELLRVGRVDAHRIVKVVLGRTALDRNGEALRHLPRLRPTDVEADDALVVVFVADELGITGVLAAM